MNNLKKHIKHFIDAFTKITTGITIVCAIFLEISNADEWKGLDHVLVQVIAAGAATALITVLCLPCTLNEREASKRECIIRYSVHYILINLCILTMGYRFGWFQLTLPSVIMMAVSVLFVYIFTTVTNYLSYKRYADEINDALKRFKE